MRPATFALGLLALLCASPVAAGDRSADLLELFKNVGLSTRVDVDQKSCSATSDLNLIKFIRSIPLLKKAGILNSDITDTQISARPLPIAIYFSYFAEKIIIRSFFETYPKDDGCDFTHSVTMPDDYGNDDKKLAFAFDFNRTLYNKVNWDNFEPTNLAKIAPNFRAGRDLLEITRSQYE